MILSPESSWSHMSVSLREARGSARGASLPNRLGLCRKKEGGAFPESVMPRGLSSPVCTGLESVATSQGSEEN